MLKNQLVKAQNSESDLRINRGGETAQSSFNVFETVWNFPQTTRFIQE